MSVHTIIRQIDTLDPFPRSAARLVEVVADETRGLSEVVDVVKMDANLTTNVIRLANSAYFSLKQPVDAIDRAVALLGGQMILEIALLTMTASTFRPPQHGYGLEENELWRHAMASAVFSRELAKHYGLSCADVVFTAGLIKDIGKVILNRYMVEACREIDDLVGTHDYPFFEAERQVLGIDHAELGALAFEKWHFPEKLIAIVGNHHLQKAPVVAPRETCTVFLADSICSMLGIGAGKDGLAYPFSEDTLMRYFDLSGFNSVVASLFPRLGSVDALSETL